jgi:hypothetical protein
MAQPPLPLLAGISDVLKKKYRQRVVRSTQYDVARLAIAGVALTRPRVFRVQTTDPPTPPLHRTNDRRFSVRAARRAEIAAESRREARPRHTGTGNALPTVPVDIDAAHGNDPAPAATTRKATNDRMSYNYVVMGVSRRRVVQDRDAVRDMRLIHDIWFPLQRGSTYIDGGNAAWAEYDTTPIACTCPDWKFRGTDSNSTASPSVRHFVNDNGRYNLHAYHKTMGALRGCKHMIAVATHLK